MYDVAVIGGGVVGAMIARTLTKYELDVCILEKENDVATGASKANSAIVHAGFDAKCGSLKAKLNVRGNQMMAEVAKELGVKYRNNGSLVIGFGAEDRVVLHELLERGAKNGVPRLEILDKDAVHKLEPSLSDKVTCALYAPTGAIVCPYELTVAAIGNAMDNGAELKCNFEVVGIVSRKDCFEIKSHNETVCSRIVINAAGLYSDKIAAMAGDNSINIHPRRGEYMLLDKECGSMVCRTVFRTPSAMGKGILISPTVDGNLLLGPTSVDISDKEDKSTHSEDFQTIISETMENADNVPLGKVITSFCGLRAVGNTGDFIINSPMQGFVNVAGIESPGLTASPAIAEYVAGLLKASGFEFKSKKDFNPFRKSMHFFREASVEEKNEIIKKDKTYGKIVCRCESVTEGEILYALRTNPKATDLDGVKRRTRAQMGRCQGGFCSPYIVELIAGELGIKYEDVTKSGEGSYINAGKTKEVL